MISKFDKIAQAINKIWDNYKLYNKFAPLIPFESRWLPAEILNNLDNGNGGEASLCYDSDTKYCYIFAETEKGKTDYGCVISNDPEYLNFIPENPAITEEQVEKCVQSVFLGLKKKLREQGITYSELGWD